MIPVSRSPDLGEGSFQMASETACVDGTFYEEKGKRSINYLSFHKGTESALFTLVVGKRTERLQPFSFSLTSQQLSVPLIITV